MSTNQDPRPDEFALLLSQREAQLLEALRALSVDDEPAATQEVSDFKELALRSSDAAMDEPHAARLSQALARVATARQRLASGRYGRCLRCGQSIDLRRLRALPEAELCMDCQREQEAHAHTHPGTPSP